MIELSKETRRILQSYQFAVEAFSQSGVDALVFEDRTVLGFALFYDDATSLLGLWQRNADHLISERRPFLRRAEQKTWNTYLVLLAGGQPTDGQKVAIDAIEHDLIGTRKIARGGITSIQSLRNALLPLLPMSNAPQLEPINLPEEIRLRTSQLPTHAVDAFLDGTDIKIVAQLLEEGR